MPVKVKPICPLGEYNSKMQIVCKKIDNLCGNQYFKACKGWWANTERAEKCPLREDKA